MRRTLKEGGVKPPKSDRHIFRLDRRLVYEIARRIDVIYPDAPLALRSLRREGCQLFLASGADSGYVKGALEAARLDRLFQETYSPDRVNAFKGSIKYWKRILESSRAQPEFSIVVDDRLRFLKTPERMGLTPILVARKKPADSKILTIRHLREVPQIVRRLQS